MTNLETMSSREQGGENGHNTRILIKFMRHGERAPSGELTDYGREVTRQKATEDKKIIGEFSGIKVFGSDFGPKGKTGMGRAIETADIYGDAIYLQKNESLEGANEKIKRYATRGRSILEIGRIQNKEPFDWVSFYNSHLPENFKELSDEEKATASHIAHEASVSRLLTEPEGEAYREEIATRLAVPIERYIKMAGRIKNGSQELFPIGGHGGFTEIFLQKALKRINKETGEEKIGFNDVAEIGGAFRPSEGFFVDIRTDESGEKHIKVFMDDQTKMPNEDLELDLGVLEELTEKYRQSHEAKETEE